MASNSLKVTLPSLQSTKVPRDPTLITENEGEKNFPHLARNDRHYMPLSHCLRQCHIWSIRRPTPGELPTALFNFLMLQSGEVYKCKLAASIWPGY